MHESDGMYVQSTMCARITTCLRRDVRPIYHVHENHDLSTDLGPATSEIGKNIMREHQNLGDSTLPLSRIQTTLFHSVLMIKASGHVF